MRDILFISKRGILINFEDFYCIFELVMSKNMKLQAHHPGLLMVCKYREGPGQSVKVREREGVLRSQSKVTTLSLVLEFMVC